MEKKTRKAPKIKKQAKRFPLSSTPNWKYQLMAKIMVVCKGKQPCTECMFWNPARSRCIVTDVTPDQWDIDLIAGLIHEDEVKKARAKHFAILRAHI